MFKIVSQKMFISRKSLDSLPKYDGFLSEYLLHDLLYEVGIPTPRRLLPFLSEGSSLVSCLFLHLRHRSPPSPSFPSTAFVFGSTFEILRRVERWWVYSPTKVTWISPTRAWDKQRA